MADKTNGLIIELPFPDPKLNPNQSNGDSWKSSRKNRDDAKEIGYVQAKSALESQTFPLALHYAIQITFYPPDRRHRDVDNLHASMKHYLDGICQALEINDKIFREVTLSFGEMRKPGATTVEIRVLEVAE